jgi:hypothetical protein
VSCQHCILTEKTSSLFEQLVSCVSHSNPFLGLLAFILKRLASLPNWCIICWDSLPVSVTRLCTCDKDLWYVSALDDSLSNCFVHFSSEYCPWLQIFA